MLKVKGISRFTVKNYQTQSKCSGKCPKSKCFVFHYKEYCICRKKWKAYFCLPARYNMQKKYHKTPLKSYRLLIFCFVKLDVLLIVNKEMLCKGTSPKVGEFFNGFFQELYFMSTLISFLNYSLPRK